MKTKTLPKLKAELQKVFNEYIRLRDKGKLCISCGKMKPLQAGHYYSVKGYDGLRFNEWNVNGECTGCNCFNDSHLILYGDNLKYRIGEDNYQLLKNLATNYKRTGYKWSRTELMDMIKEYKEKLKLF